MSSIGPWVDFERSMTRTLTTPSGELLVAMVYPYVGQTWSWCVWLPGNKDDYVSADGSGDDEPHETRLDACDAADAYLLARGVP